MENKIEDHEIPLWMLTTEENEYNGIGKSNTSFLKRTILEFSKIIQNDMQSERNAQKNGLLQKIDPRLKIASVVAFLLITGFVHSIIALVFLAIIAGMLVKLSSLEFSSYVKRVWLTLPLLVFIVSMIAGTSLIIPGKPLFYIYNDLNLQIGFLKLPNELYFSEAGIQSILKIFLRTGISFSFGYIIVMTTYWNLITKSLSAIRIPNLIISVLDMTYRYIFVLLRISTEMFEARILRTVGTIKNKSNRAFVSSSMAYLFVKSNYLSEEIFDSMLCRGYTGKPVALFKFKLTSYDYIWMLNSLVIFLIICLGEMIYG